MCPETMESCDRAAVHAFPVDLSSAVFGASCLTNTKLLDQAFLALHIFLFGLCLVVVSCLDAVNEPSKVRLFAVIALVESCALESVCKSVAVVCMLGVVNASLFK